MTTYELTCEFDIARRIGWSDEELGLHIDMVFERLHQADGIEKAEAQADLDSGRATIALMVATDDPEPQRVACASLAVAIRSCGGGHQGLLPLREEAVLRPGRNSWSGLRIPTWTVRQKSFEQES
ncbi:MAG: hypothetical protein ABFR95_06140 [Actinomycetota bacterium]